MKGQFSYINMDGPRWNLGEWEKRFDDGEATLAEMEEHGGYLMEEGFMPHRSLDLEQMQGGVRYKISKILFHRGVNISDVPGRLIGLTQYRLNLKKYRNCTRIIVRNNYDYWREDKVVVEFYDNQGYFIGDIVEK